MDTPDHKLDLTVSHPLHVSSVNQFINLSVLETVAAVIAGGRQ